MSIIEMKKIIIMTKKYKIPRSEFNNKKYITPNLKKSIKYYRRALNKILINGVTDHFTRWHELAI